MGFQHRPLLAGSARSTPGRSPKAEQCAFLPRAGFIQQKPEPQCEYPAQDSDNPSHWAHRTHCWFQGHFYHIPGELDCAGFCVTLGTLAGVRRGGTPWEINDLGPPGSGTVPQGPGRGEKGQVGLRPPEVGTVTPQPGSLPGPTRSEVSVGPGVSPAVLTGEGGQVQVFAAP